MLEPDKRKAPIVAILTVESGQDRILPLVAEELRDEVALHRPGAVAGRRSRQPDVEHPDGIFAVEIRSDTVRLIDIAGKFAPYR